MEERLRLLIVGTGVEKSDAEKEYRTEEEPEILPGRKQAGQREDRVPEEPHHLPRSFRRKQNGDDPPTVERRYGKKVETAEKYIEREEDAQKHRRGTRKT